MPNKDEVQKSLSLVQNYLSGVRGAIPLAKEQLEIMMRIIKEANITSGSFLDIGCSNGILAATILEQYPSMQGVYIDFSEPMLEAAKEKLRPYLPNLKVILLDYGNPYHLYPRIYASIKKITI